MNEEQREKNRLKALKWRQANPEKAREATRRWQEANRERYLQQRRRYYADHAEEIKAGVRKWCKENSERKRATDAAWREAHRDELRRKGRERYYRLKGGSPEERPVRDEAGTEAWRAEFAGRWAELADRLGPEGLLLRLAALMRKERRR